MKKMSLRAWGAHNSGSTWQYIISCIISICMLITSLLYAEAEQTSASVVSQARFEGLYLLDTTYEITSGDILMIYLTGDVNESHNLSVGLDGKIVVPRIGEIHLAGFTVKKSEEILEKEISKYYKNIGITIHVMMPNFKRSILKDKDIITILGEINYPGIYNINVGEKISSVIYKSGGFRLNADLKRAYVERNVNNNKTKINIDIDELLVKKNAGLDIEVKNGDIIYVPPKSGVALDENIIIVQGEVPSPGIYNIIKGETAGSMIVRAGGFKPTADLRKSTIAREVHGKKEVIAVDLNEILVQKKTSQDIELKNGDILVVPTIPHLVNVIGSVFKPGAYEYSPGAPVSYYIGLCGGFTEKSSNSVNITTLENKKINSENYTPQPGDTLYVPEAFFSLVSWHDYMQILFDFLALYTVYVIIFKK